MWIEESCIDGSWRLLGYLDVIDGYVFPLGGGDFLHVQRNSGVLLRAVPEVQEFGVESLLHPQALDAQNVGVVQVILYFYSYKSINTLNIPVQLLHTVPFSPCVHFFALLYWQKVSIWCIALFYQFHSNTLMYNKGYFTSQSHACITCVNQS